ncbi:MAG: HD domain-containing protein [Vallitalea sp.]|jgi:3'-5' exoribonuclease|nr:HD domain-containing protein [Vallitalea sp.]
MRYIADLKEGEQVQEHYLCVNKQVLKTRAGKTYYSLKLQDKTGVVDAKIWDLNDGINDFNEHEYIKIDASVITFQNSIQLNIRRLRKSSEGEYEPREYIPVSNRDINEMYDEIMVFVNDIENKYLSALVKKFFVEDKEFIKAFKDHTAAKTMHHSYLGGLLEHTLCVVKMCEFFANQYSVINKDVLYTAALFHDIGKMKELSKFPIIEYTDSGQLLGHIMIGIEWIGEKMKEIVGFPEDLAHMIKHCILAHHGELEYGSPKKPQTIEALALHFADNSDAKLRTFQDVLENGDIQDNWLGWQRIFESNVRRTRF